MDQCMDVLYWVGFIEGSGNQTNWDQAQNLGQLCELGCSAHLGVTCNQIYSEYMHQSYSKLLFVRLPAMGKEWCIQWRGAKSDEMGWAIIDIQTGNNRYHEYNQY